MYENFTYLYYVVVKIQFASTKFTGSESSGEILVSVVVTGKISDKKVNIMIALNQGTATG